MPTRISLKSLASLLIAAALIFVGSADASAQDGASPAQSFFVEDYVSELQFPVGVAATPGGDLLVTEKFGTVRLIRDGELLDNPIASVDVTAQNEAGLIGIQPMPDYEESGEFLIVYTPEEPLDKIFVSHMQLDDDRARMLEERWLELPSRAGTDRHYAANLRFTADGEYLFIALGDLRQDELAQNLDRLPGSILRYNADGTIPDDNPFGSDSPIFAYGLRNPFDFDLDAEGRPYAIENGADVNDEINFIEPGNNYGWPLLEGYCDNLPIHEPCDDADLFTDPAFEFRTITGPTGVVVYKGELFEDLQGDILSAGWHSGVVHQLRPRDGDPSVLEKLGIFYVPGGDMGITDIEVDRDGAILVVLAGSSGGEIKRLVPADGQRQAEQSEEGSSGCSVASENGAPLPAAALMLVGLGLGLVVRRRA
jgi:MYXO-CTERM domain-containing protein